MEKKISLVVLVITVFGVIVTTLGSSYNLFLRKEEDINKQYSDLLKQLEYKTSVTSDLLTVLEEHNFEERITDNITTANQKLIEATSIEELSRINVYLTNQLKIVIVSIRTDLDFNNEKVTKVLDELEVANNQVINFSQDYNEAVTSYNSDISKFPISILADIYGFKERKYFD